MTDKSQEQEIAPDNSLDGEDIPDYVRGNADESDSDDSEQIEEQARAMGWKPEDEYTGKPGRWTSAEQFLEVHAKNNGALRKALEKQSQEMQEFRDQLQGLGKAHRTMFELQLKKAKDEHAQELALVKAQRAQARRDGDFELAEQLDEQLESVQKRGPELPDIPETKVADDPNAWRRAPGMPEWLARNDWFDKDEDMRDFAVVASEKLRKSNPTMPADELLTKTTERVRNAFPTKFKTRASPVEGATPGAGREASGSRSYASLPRDAKDMCDEVVAEGTMTQKEWVAAYYNYDDVRKAR